MDVATSRRSSRAVRCRAEYDTADAIRDRLRNEFGVSVDDEEGWAGRIRTLPAALCRPAGQRPFVVVDAPPRPPRLSARRDRGACRGGRRAERGAERPTVRPRTALVAGAENWWEGRRLGGDGKSIAGLVRPAWTLGTAPSTCGHRQ